MEEKQTTSDVKNSMENARQGKNFEVAILLDIYGAMLTQKQYDLIDLYYNEDLSLGEISVHQNITRQGVRDSIKRGEMFLFELEEKLCLLKKQKENQQVFEEIIELSTAINKISTRYGYDINITKASEKITQIATSKITQ